MPLSSISCGLGTPVGRMSQSSGAKRNFSVVVMSHVYTFLGEEWSITSLRPALCGDETAVATVDDRHNGSDC